MKNIFKIKENKKGVALLITILLMSLVLFLSLYFLSFSLTEKKISSSQTLGTKTYYSAEAGIAEMVWRLKNNDSYKNSFQTDPDWTASFTRENPFGADSGSYTVAIANTSQAVGEITSTGSIDIGDGKTSQRIIKTNVYRMVGLSGMGTNAVINGGGNIHILNSEQTDITGDIYSNSDIEMQGSHPGVGVVGGSLTTTGEIEEGNGDLTVSGIIQDEDSVPAPAPIDLPGVDFGSLQSQSNTILANDAALDAVSTVDGITWVNTAASIGHNMNINGLLVVNGNLTINNSAVITVNHTVGFPSGIIVNGNLLIEKMPRYDGNIIINGLLYATGSITLNKLNSGYTFLVTGGVTSGNGILIKNCSRTIEIVYDNDILVDSPISSGSSPVIVIDHWEEEY